MWYILHKQTEGKENPHHQRRRARSIKQPYLKSKRTIQSLIELECEKRERTWASQKCLVARERWINSGLA